ncbi:hypothetical protein CR513_30298, partial [Mucuna pruriens]
MNKEYLEYYKKEIQEYLDKTLIRPSKSPWSCTRFYVMKASEIERGAPRLSGYYQIGVKEQDRYKIAFVVHFGIPDPKPNLIVETDASDLGYRGILKQKLP